MRSGFSLALGQAAAPRTAGKTDALDWRDSRVRPRDHRPDGPRVRCGPGAPRDRHERQDRAQGDRPQRRRIAQLLSRMLLGRAGGDFAGVTGWRRLFLRTLNNLRQVEVGFNPQNLVLFRVNPQLNRYDDSGTEVVRPAAGTLRAIPGCAAQLERNPALLSGSVNWYGIYVQGRTYAPDERDSINRLVVSPNFLK